MSPDPHPAVEPPERRDVWFDCAFCGGEPGRVDCCPSCEGAGGFVDEDIEGVET